MATNYSDPKYTQQTLDMADLQSRGYLPDEIAARQSNVDLANQAATARVANRQKQDAFESSPQGVAMAARKGQVSPRRGNGMVGSAPTSPTMNQLMSNLGPQQSPEDMAATKAAIAAKNTANQAMAPAVAKPYAKGGKISLDHCGVSTTPKGKRNSNW